MWACWITVSRSSVVNRAQTPGLVATICAQGDITTGDLGEGRSRSGKRPLYRHLAFGDDAEQAA
jgi:hypothetical protein